jgi:hypothetical protein
MVDSLGFRLKLGIIAPSIVDPSTVQRISRPFGAAAA